MLAECFIRAGYHTGDDLIPASESNPHGFFEDLEVNRLNDRLLRRHFAPSMPVPDRLQWLGAHQSISRRDDAGHLIDLDDMRAAVPPSPFVIKDPRLSWTFPLWRPVVASAVVIVMVRSPGEVFDSLVEMSTREPGYFGGHVVDEVSVGQMWTSIYTNILQWAEAPTIFVRETDVRDGTALAMLSHRCGVTLNQSGIDPELHRQHHTSTAAFPAVADTLIVDVNERCDKDLRPPGAHSSDVHDVRVDHRRSGLGR